MASYQDKLNELQRLTKMLEKEDLELEKAMDTYVQARSLIDEMKIDLMEAESRMSVHVIDEQGKLGPLPERPK